MEDSGTVRQSDIEDSLYLQEVNGTQELFYSGNQVTTNKEVIGGQWEVKSGTTDTLVTKDTAKNVDMQNKNIDAVENISTDSVTLVNDEPVTSATKIYKNGVYIYYGSDRLNDNTHGLWEYDDVAETRIRPKIAGGSAYPDVELKDKRISGALEVELKDQSTVHSSPNSGYAYIYNVAASGVYQKPYLYNQDKPVSPFRYYLDTGVDTYVQQFGINANNNYIQNIEGLATTTNSNNVLNGTNTAINTPLQVSGVTQLNNATQIFSQATSGAAVFNGTANFNNTTNINAGGSIVGSNTFTIGNTTLTLGSATNNMTGTFNHANGSLTNFLNGSTTRVENQDDFELYESDWVNWYTRPQDFAASWFNGNTLVPSQAVGYKNLDAWSNGLYFLSGASNFKYIQNGIGTTPTGAGDDFRMSIVGVVDGQSSTQQFSPKYRFQSNDLINRDGYSLPAGVNCVEADNLSAKNFVTAPRLLFTNAQGGFLEVTNIKVGTGLESAADDILNFIDSAGNTIGSITSAIGGVVGAVVTAGGILAGGLLVGAGVGVAGMAMGGSSRDPNNPTNPDVNKILYAGDNGALWNSGFFGRTDVGGNNTFNYLTNGPIGMVLNPTNNNLLYGTDINRDQLWKFGVNHKCQTFGVNMVGLTTDYGTSTTAFSETAIFSNTIPGAYDQEFPCFTYEPIMGRSHGQELCSIALKDYTDFNTARYLDINTRNYVAVPKTNRLYVQGGTVMFEEDPIIQNKLDGGSGKTTLAAPTQFSNQFIILTNDLQTANTNREVNLQLSTGSSVDSLNFNTHNLLTPLGGDINVLGQTHMEFRESLTTHRKNVDMRSTLTFKDASTGNNQGSIFADETLDAIRFYGRVQGDPNYNLEEKMRVGINFINLYEPVYSQFDIIFQQQNDGIYFKDAANNNLLLTYSTTNNRLEFNGAPIGGGGSGNEDKYFTLSSGTATSTTGIDKYVFNALIEGTTNNANQTPLAKFSKTSNASNASILVEQGYTGGYLNIGPQYIDGSYRNCIYSYGGIEGQTQGNPRLTFIDSRYDGLSAGLAGVEITNRLKLLNQTAIEFDATYGVAQTLGDHLLTLGNNNTDGDNLYFNTYRVLTSDIGLEKTLTSSETIDLANNSLTFSNGDLVLNSSAITIPQFVPGTTTNKLYVDGNGKLNYNGALVAGDEDKYFTTSGSTAVNVLNNMLLRPVGTNDYSELEFRSPWSGGGNYSLFVSQFNVPTPAITYGSVASTSNKLNLSVNASTPQGSSDGVFITNDTTAQTVDVDMNTSNWVSGASINHGAITQAKYISHHWNDGTKIIDNDRVRIRTNNNDVVLVNNNTLTASNYGDLVIRERTTTGVVPWYQKGGLRFEDPQNGTQTYTMAFTNYGTPSMRFCYDNNHLEERSFIHRPNGSQIDFNSTQSGTANNYNLHLGTWNGLYGEYYLYGTHNRFAVGLGSGSTATWHLTSSGWANVSDRRIKSNIQDVSDEKTLEFIQKATPKTYTLHNKFENQLGFVAQDVESLGPEFVDTSEDYIDIPVVSGKKQGKILQFTKPHNLQTGGNYINAVRFFCEDNDNPYDYKFKIEDNYTIRLEGEPLCQECKEEKCNIRITGQKVNDFKNVNYSTMAVMTQRAVQYLYKQMGGSASTEDPKVKIATLTYENQQLRERLDKVESILLKYNMK